MTNKKCEGFLTITKSAFCMWISNLFPLAAIYAALAVIQKSLSVLFRSYGPVKQALASRDLSAPVAVMFGLFVLLNAIVGVFFTLVAINTLRREAAGKPFLLEAVKDAAGRLASFFKAFLALCGFVFVGLFLSSFFLEGGKALYAFTSKGGNYNLALGILLVSSTIFVVLVIAVAWYGFSFSLAPLVAAYEQKTPIASIKASRDRVRGNALKYLCAVAAGFLFYLVFGLGVLVLITRFTHDRQVLNMLDPAMFVLFGPLWLAAWYASYTKLTELKTSV